jgi:hypothetical protein
MIDYLYLGPTPGDENCAQVGDDNFREQCNKEMDVYIAQLKRMYPETANYKGISFKKHWQQHDFGSYGEVIITYNDEVEEEETLALKVEWNLPRNWDEIAKEEISEKVNKGK